MSKMSLYSEWQELIGDQSQDTVDEFWKEYSDAETRIDRKSVV